VTVTTAPRVQSTLTLDEFSRTTYEAWKQAASDTLKNASFEQALIQRVEGLRIAPLYAADEPASNAAPLSPPGCFPFVRGNRRDDQPSWRIGQLFRCADPILLAEMLKADLDAGLEAAHLPLDPAQTGRVPFSDDDELSARPGICLTSLAEFLPVVAAARLSHVPVFMDLRCSGGAGLAFLCAACDRLGVSRASLRGVAGMSPLSQLAQAGRLPCAPEALFGELCAITGFAHREMPMLRTAIASGLPFHNAGATPAEEVGLVLAECAELLQRMTDGGIHPDVAVNSLCATVSAGHHFFLEIAKLRALRQLFAYVATACGASPEHAALEIHSLGSRRHQSRRNPHVNLLRAITATVSAALGGADSIHCAPFDEFCSDTDAFSRRLARNVQLIAREECHLGDVCDPVGGSWYVESLTEQVAEAAWTLFVQIEQEGGYLAALRSGTINDRLRTGEEQRQLALSCRLQKLVGVNAYVNFDRTPLEVEPSMASTSGPATTCPTGCHGEISGADRTTLDDAIQLVRDGATFDAVSGLFSGPQSIIEIAPLPARRPAAAIEDAQDRVLAYPGGRPMALLACVGDASDAQSAARAARELLDAFGFITRMLPAITAVADVERVLRDGSAPVLVLCGLDKNCPDGMVETAAIASRLHPASVVCMAGRPGEREEALRAAGVRDFIFRGVDGVALVHRLMDALEGRQ